MVDKLRDCAISNCCDSIDLNCSAIVHFKKTKFCAVLVFRLLWYVAIVFLAFVLAHYWNGKYIVLLRCTSSKQCLGKTTQLIRNWEFPHGDLDRFGSISCSFSTWNKLFCLKKNPESQKSFHKSCKSWNIYRPILPSYIILYKKWKDT